MKHALATLVNRIKTPIPRPMVRTWIWIGYFFTIGATIVSGHFAGRIAALVVLVIGYTVIFAAVGVIVYINRKLDILPTSTPVRNVPKPHLVWDREKKALPP